ncbi:hypothetical protein PS1_007718 [Malus domestica]
MADNDEGGGSETLLRLSPPSRSIARFRPISRPCFPSNFQILLSLQGQPHDSAVANTTVAAQASLSLPSSSEPNTTQMAINRDSTSFPMIGKIGSYTVFMTPPEPVFESPRKMITPVFESPKKAAPPPVQQTPQQLLSPLPYLQIPRPMARCQGFSKNAVTKVQKAHSSLDDHWHTILD